MALRSVASPTPSHSSASRARVAITLGAAFAFLCVALFGWETAESFAANGFLEELFGGGSTHYVPTLPYNGHISGATARRSHFGHYRRHVRHANRRHRAHYAHAPRHVAERQRVMTWEHDDAPPRRVDGIETVSFAERSAAATNSPASPNRKTVCVRGCDGYFFPIATLGKGQDLIAQQAACEKLCPGAQARLFVMPAGSDKIGEAKAAKGSDTYAQIVARLNPAEDKSKSCSCQSGASAIGDTATFRADPTLRPGDTVVTSQGVRVLRRGSHYPFKDTDFLSLAETRDVPLSQRSALFAIERVLKTPHGRLAAMNGDHRHRRDLRL